MTNLAPTPIGVTRQAPSSVLAGAKAASIGSLLALLVAVIAAGPLPAAAADAQPDHAGAVAGPTADTSRQRARVQPQAWEFSAPSGASDLSPKDTRDVEELYQQLMHGALTQRPPGDRPGAGERS
jgi:hypothetical protein